MIAFKRKLGRRRIALLPVLALMLLAVITAEFSPKSN